jgi:membrane-associated phospholipid phosphatase
MLPGFTDVIDSTHAFGNFHSGALASQANQLAAMPSLHMAWAAWCALALWRMSSRRWVRGLALAYPCLTALAVMATGNHFALDLVAGLAALLAAALLLRAVSAARHLRSSGPRTNCHKVVTKSATG